MAKIFDSQQITTNRTYYVEENTDLPKVGIMLVEDDPAILKLTTRLLSALGYNVHAAEGGNAALAKYAEHKNDIKVVLTDMQMPDLSGRELAEKLQEDQPDLPIVFVSGYALEQVSSEVGEGPNIHFIQKPFTKAKLSDVVNKALGIQV
jgi:CheY-like chemotaxis protein